MPTDLAASLEEGRKRFLARVKEIRPRLHRFCSRMTGSVLDGEDLVQETLAQAFYSLASLREESRLEPWLFRIAHHKCIDFLRREGGKREATVTYDDALVPEGTTDDLTVEEGPVDEALMVLVASLPPMERACLVLMDVLDYRLSEIAEVVDSTVGGVKAALHRGRTKLRALPVPVAKEALDAEQRTLLEAYVACFNRRDWDALRHLVRADARIEVVGVIEGVLGDPEITYFGNYGKLPFEWRLSLTAVDGAELLVQWRKSGAEWRPATAVRLWWEGGKVVRIRDYVHVEYLLQGAAID